MEFQELKNFSIKSKILIVLFCDILISIFATYSSFVIRYESLIIPVFPQLLVFVLSIGIFIPLFFYLKVYKTAIQYDDLNIFINYLISFLLYSILFFISTWLISSNINFDQYSNNAYSGIPFSIPLIQAPIFFLIFFLIRVIAKIFIYQNVATNSPYTFLIYGTEPASVELCNILLSRKYNFAGFIENNLKYMGDKFYGKNFFDLSQIDKIVKKYNVTDIVIAKPSISKVERNKIAKELIRNKIKVRVLPDLADVINGSINYEEIKEINPIHLLDRKVTNYFSKLVQKNINKKNILITGAGGSIGSEIVRKILNENSNEIILFDHSEIALYKIQEEVINYSKNNNLNFKFQCLLGDVNDYEFMRKIIDTNKIDSIYHCAAYKHVPIIEDNIYAGLRNNAFGTLNLVKASMGSSVKSFTLISTDKAVNPTSVMGASKRIAEQIVQSAYYSRDNVEKTKFSLVRFGNVLDSSGSVIPLFRNQIKNGGPVTLTDQEVSRYFMTIPEAAELVLQASGLASGGEIFVLNMGKPIKIFDLAKKCIEMSGLHLKDFNNPNGDIEIKIIGLRPGEKLHEELLIGKNPKETSHPDIIHAFETFIPYEEIIKKLDNLNLHLLNFNKDEISKSLEDLVEGSNIEIII